MDLNGGNIGQKPTTKEKLMKKAVWLGLAAILCVGCSSTQYHNGRGSILLEQITVEPRPLQADITVGPAISGVAECESWFGIRTKKPQKQTYGISLQTDEGNFVPNDCTRGAVYNALTNSKSDVIIAPRYTSVKKGSWCLFGLCLHVTDQIIVTGYGGKIHSISPMPEDIVRERRVKTIPQSPVNSQKRRRFFGLF